MNQNTIQQIVTKENLVEALHAIGVKPGMILEVHSSLSSLGYVVGGARSVVDALMEVSGETGTILMPTQTNDNSDPSSWENPPVSPSLWQEIRDAMPGYDAQETDLFQMGSIVENFRHRDGVVCSNHPQYSYAAWGRYAKLLCNRQSIHFPLAEESPTARLYELKGYILLIGTQLDSATCLHLAEYRTESRPMVIENSCTIVDGRRVWKKYLNLDLDSEDFTKIDTLLEKKGVINSITLGDCKIQLIPANVAIDEATNYLAKNVVYDLYR